MKSGGGRGLESRRVKEVEPPSKYKKEETPASEDFYFFLPFKFFLKSFFLLEWERKQQFLGWVAR